MVSNVITGRNIRVTIREPAPKQPLPEWARRLEVQALMLQCLLAAAFILTVREGDNRAQGVAIAINSYHLLRVGYLLFFRLRGRNLRGVATVIPLLDVMCITAAWSVAGGLAAPVWGLYLYAIVNHGQTFRRTKLAAFGVFIVANMAFAMMAIGSSPLAVAMNANFWTMVLVVAAVGSLTQATRTAWFGAEHNARHLAHTDPLTGIGNRRWLTECLDEISSDLQPYAVLMMDLDNFKQINDQYGHDMGDLVLVRAARLIAESLRPDDIVGRFGGEEFVVVLPGASMAEARAVAERLREKIQAGTPTSISVGVAIRSPHDTQAEVLQKADALMLIAKRTGKNSVRSELVLVA